MYKKNNIYNYEAPKSMNEEVHYFLTKGRITRTAFFVRFLLCFTVVVLCFVVYLDYALPKKLEKIRLLKDGSKVIYDTTFNFTFIVFESITFYVLPLLAVLFILIQAAKRMHDVNKSGWFSLIPGYNLLLLCSEGHKGNNDYGIDPRPQKRVKYFDELKS